MLLPKNVKIVVLYWAGCFVSSPFLFGQQGPMREPSRPGPVIERRIEVRRGSQRGPGRFRSRRPAAQRPGGIWRALQRPEVQKEVGLTEEQKNRLQEIRLNSAKALIEQHAALQVQRLELDHLMRAKNPDRAAVNQKMQEIGRIRMQLSQSAMNAMLDARSVLSDEQRTQLRELERARRAPERRATGERKPAKKKKGTRKERGRP